MPIRLLAAASRLADAPDAEAVVFDNASEPIHIRLSGPGRYLRIRDLDAALDFRAAADVDGVLLGGAEGPADVERLCARLAVVEAEADLPDGMLRIVPVIDTPHGILSLAAFRPLPRLAGLVCDPERLMAALGCTADAPAIVQARALTVLAAAACGVPAILVVREMDTTAEREGFAAILLDDRL